jgi:glycosyltransferase involved in cell wall biosynthesis
MVGFAFFVMSFLAVRVLISLVNLLTRSSLPAGVPDGLPLLSVLIPARNEARSLPVLLDDLRKTSYTNVEIIVCDDHSSDTTPDVLQSYARKMDNLSYFKSEPLPEGWLGKNFACHQLALRAKGDYLLFLDADVRIAPGTPSKAISYIQKSGRTLVSVFPTQLMYSFGELSTVPIMNWVLLSLLPLPLVRHTRNPSLSAANGQFMLFDAFNYRQNNWHRQVKGESTEDITLSRLIKKSGARVATLTGGADVFCRMYESYGEAIGGFSRNVHQYFGNSRLIMLIFFLTILFGWLPVWFYWGWTGIKWFLMLVIANRVFIAMLSKQNSLSVILHPLQMVTFAVIAFRNVSRRIKGHTEWKGRTIKF